MNTRIIVSACVLPHKGVVVEFEQRLEVSLDCLQCGRTDRTVMFDRADEDGCCIKTRHRFAGRVGPVQVRDRSSPFRRELECSFELSYDYAEFRDSKVPGRRSRAVPDWGRVHFKATCPQCGATTQRSIQNNQDRPWSCACTCGYPLYREEVEYPAFRPVPA